MCGITAVLNSKPSSSHAADLVIRDRDLIIRAADLIKVRGPDATAIHEPRGNLIIFHRLAINDQSFDGMQPMSKGSVTMVCNGEIYNWRELVAKHNLTLRSGSDCEVVLELYLKLGFEMMVRELYGVYAILLIDSDTVYLARDRVGIRPLYHAITHEGLLAVSSTPLPLVQFCDPATIKPFQPGCYGVYTKRPVGDHYHTGPPVIRQTLFHPFPGPSPFHDMEDLTWSVGKCKELLEAAVKIRTVAGRPIGCLLSGGLDSSVVTAILCKHLSPANVRTYSVGMEGSPDLMYARKVAEWCGTTHHEVIFTPEQGLAEIPNVIRRLASRDITTIRASVGMSILAKWIKANTPDTVIFSGDGSDELGSYLYFRLAPSAREFEAESLRLLQSLHLYDVKRAEEMLAQGLEGRFPYLDHRFVDWVLSLSPEFRLRYWGGKGEIEKYMLRLAFKGELPNEVLWRQKCAFSDGVATAKKSWVQIIQDHAATIIPDELFNERRYMSKEHMMYHLIFQREFTPVEGVDQRLGCAIYEPNIPVWMPKWCDATDPSARTLAICDENPPPLNEE